MKTSADLRNEFTKVVKGRNFMTPDLIGFFEIKNGVCELSHGDGIFSKDLFGVTCVVNGENNHDLSTSFQNKQDALDYIETLK